MKRSVSIEEQIKFFLAQMEKAMPEVRRQVKVYEKRLKDGKLKRTPAIPSQFKHV